MIRHGPHVPSQCPKHKHFPPVLVAIFNISVGWLPLFRALAKSMAPMTNIPCSFSPEILKMATNTGGKCFCLGLWLGTWHPWRIMTTAPYAFFNEVAPLCSLYSLVLRCIAFYLCENIHFPLSRLKYVANARFAGNIFTDL